MTISIKVAKDGSSKYNCDTKSCGQDTLEYLKSSSLFKDDDLSCHQETIAYKIDKLMTNEEWKLTTDEDGDGKFEEENLADAIANSFDSELDLYIQNEFEKIIDKYGTKMKNFFCDEAMAELKEKGIIVNSVGSEDGFSKRVYSFTLVDENGNVLEDENGNKGNILFADCLIPDGYAQGAERNLSSILDVMGKDCVSKADFIGNEDDYYKLLSEVETGLKNGDYKSDGTKINDIYSKTLDISEAVDLLGRPGGSAPGMGGGVISSAISSAASNLYNKFVNSDLVKGILNLFGVSNTDNTDSTDKTGSTDDYKKQVNQVYNARLEKLKASYKNDNGTEASGTELTRLENQAKTYIKTEYGSDGVSAINN